MISHYNLYEILKVDKRATTAEIKKAYRLMAFKYHPDVNPDGTEMFQKIKSAYDILSDPSKRWKYDNQKLNTIVDDADKFLIEYFKTVFNQL